jgi:hypothetical protein
MPNSIIELEHLNAYSLMNLGKRDAAAAIAQQLLQDNCNTDEAEVALIRCKKLDDLLDVLLNPNQIGDLDNILDWIYWLMAGGKTFDEFSSAGNY